MKYLAILLFALSAFWSWSDVVRAQNTKPWVEVSRIDEFFRVSMPRQPVVATQRTRVGDIYADGSRFEAFADGAVYTLWAFVDANQGSRRGLDEYLDACADLIWEGLLNTTRDPLPDDKRARAFMSYVKELPLPLPGREYSLSMEGLTGTVRFYVAPRRIYVLLAANSPGGLWERERFFESFSVFIVPPPPQHGPGISAASNEVTDSNQVFSGREVTQKVRVLAKPEPVYTEGARRYRITGTVVLRAVFSGDGKVTDIYVIRKLPHGLTGAAIRAARGISFSPAVKDGHPISMYIELQYNFNLF